MDAETVAETIIDQCSKYGLNLNKLRGLGYDGCSTMAGKETGVHVRIRSGYPLAVFVHCSAHRFTLVVNNLKAVVDVRNTIGTVKAIIKYFRRARNEDTLYRTRHCYVKQGGAPNTKA